MRETGSPPSPLGAASASAAFPGWGQIRAGHRRLGSATVAGFALFLLAATVAVADEGAIGVVGWILDPEVLLALLGLNLLIATIRVWSTTHAWVISGGRLASLGLAVVVLLVCVPHVALSYYGYQTRSTLIAIFPNVPEPAPPVAAADSTTTTSTTIATTTSPPSTIGTTTTVPGAPTLLEPQTTTTPTLVTTTTSPAFDSERFTLLLLGGDAVTKQRGLRTDTMIVASIDTTTGDAALFSLPRNMGGFTFSDGSLFPGLSRGLLNEVYQWGWRNQERFPGADPGALAVSDVAATLLGIPIDNFVLIDMVGFAEMVDVLGGVSVGVERETLAPVYDRATGTHTMITIPAGSQTFDGDEALAYARSRTGSNDYDRMGRQRCLLTAIGGQMDPVTLFARLPLLLDTVERRVTTDISLSKIPDMVNLAPMISSDRTVVVGFDRGYRDGRTESGLSKPDIGAIHAAVQTALAAEATSGGELPVASAACMS